MVDPLSQNRLGIQEQVPLAPMTTIGIGGPAKYFAAAHTREQLQALIAWARARDLAFFVLGGGSNLLFGDDGFNGLVIHMQLKGIDSVPLDDGRVRVTAAAGENWDAFTAYCVAKGWAGISCLSGIPGLVGAAPIQNIGAYGQEVAQTIFAVTALDLESGTIQRRNNADCEFAYRDSIFKRRLRGRAVVLSVTFDLKPGGTPQPTYPELVKRLDGQLDLATVRETVLAIRREKSMVADADDPNARSCGSFFTNPMIDAAAYAAFQERCPTDHPAWPMDGGRVKLSAAWLIERSGFHKGYVAGGAGLSQKHCLAVINRANAKASEILALKETIQQGVLTTFGIELEPEPLLLSEDPIWSKNC
ncbi:UDP-N-acetylmuramate dehydrogenase [Acanthopleuribacter pedis]|uniref:UDP-N-acetylenolpyruvoylglucosamine reductase n=1 Tax=Acanthopleuribacter pedis TaxID=442870 RepID=A0A8J7U800_9BACT|nr:UDP-N-acetylmuramate dehydrogenase [Acanthopleuribacter pedis]MBO1323053.1 UDP-N-acetylmuramate dehydrogenase [Acanthopleuribacter pedis]